MLVSIVVPLHDEEGNVDALVQGVISSLRGPRFSHDFELILLDDNSSDATLQRCQELAKEYHEIRVIHRSGPPGFGRAVKRGLEEAAGDVIIPFMGDLSDDPDDIPELVDAIENGYDIAYGSRFTEGGSVAGYPPLKLLYNRSFNNLIRVLFGIRAKDTTNAFSAYRKEVIEEIGVDSLRSTSFDITAELPLRAHILGFRSTEVPVSWRSREHGASKLNATKKGPLYLKRLVHQFVVGNIVGLKDLFGGIATGNPYRILGAVLLGLLILFGVFSIAGFEDVFALLLDTNVSWLAVAGVFYLLSFGFRTWRYRVLLRTADHLATRTGVFRSIMAGWFVNFLLPARAGDAARALALKTTESVPFSVGFGLVVIERILDMVVLGGSMVIVAIVVLQNRQTRLLAMGAIAIGIVLAVGIIVVYTLDNQVADALESRLPTIRDSVAAFNAAMERVVRNPYAILLSLLLTVPVWVFEVSTIWFSARAVGLVLGPLTTVTVGIAGFLAQAVPVTPAGIGTYEATISAVFAVFGIPADVGTTIALVDHFTRAAVTYTVGAIALIHIGFQSRAYFRERSSDTNGDESDTIES